MSRPTFQQLFYLVTLADEGHFGRAAERCHVSQPALSSQIRELERRLGSTLVERLPKGMHLTSTGIDVVARARLILSGLDELVDAAESGGSAITGSLVVGAIPTVAPYILSDFVTAVRNLHPGASLRFVELRTDELLVALRSGQIDLGICALPVVGRDLIAAHVLDDEFLLAVSTTSSLAEGSDPLPISILGKLNVLLLTEGHCLRDQALAVCSNVRSQTTDLRATSLHTLVQMVAADVGVTLLPVTAGAVEARIGNGIVLRRFAKPPKRELALVWRASSPRGARYQTLADSFAKALVRVSPNSHRMSNRSLAS